MIELNASIVVFIIFVMLTVSISFAAFGQRSGDPNCQCTSRSDYGWRGFSVSWFVMSLAIGIIVVIYVIRKDGKNAFLFKG